MMSETSALRLIAIDGFEPIRDYLIHPDVLDKSKWYQNKLWFTDPKEIFSINTAAAAEPIHLDFRYNTKLVSRENIGDIRSIFDFVDPKWRGKITAIPPTSTRVSYFNIVAHPGFEGEKFLRRLFDPALKVFWSEDSRIIVDGIARGRFAFGIQLGSLDQELDDLATKGAPVARLDPAKELAEGMMLSGAGSGDQLQIAKKPPNPNIAKLFVNWWLSREGQTARHQMSVSQPSPTLRNDVECPGSGEVNPAHCRKAGRTDYVYLGADPKYSAKRQALFDQTVTLFKKTSGR
jgi:ABC-type Fe3+ transport system substrate-binding protein